MTIIISVVRFVGCIAIGTTAAYIGIKAGERVANSVIDATIGLAPRN